MASAIIEINSKTNQLMKLMQDLDNLLGLYIDMKGDLEKFNLYIEAKFKEKEEKENDQSSDGTADKPNLQRDTDGESSGTKGVRKKAK